MRGRLAGALAWSVVIALAVTSVVAALGRPDLFPDLTVYRAASGALGQGGVHLDQVRGSNGGLFTYPPAAALLLWPLRLAPVAVVGSLLAAASMVAAASCARLGARCAPWWIAGAAVACALETVPFRNTISFGQVGVLLMAMVAFDLLLPATPWPRGVLTGLAAAIKLTPAIFIVYLLLAGRRDEARRATAAFVAAAVIGFALLPRASWRFWASDAWHTDRVGDITTDHNRSLWGLLVRAGAPTLAVLLVCLVVAAAGVIWAARAEHSNPAAALTAVGLTGCLISPITWTHHMVWVLLALTAILATPTDIRYRIAGAGVVTVTYARLSPNQHMLAAIEVAATAGLVLALPLLAHHEGSLVTARASRSGRPSRTMNLAGSRRLINVWSSRR